MKDTELHDASSNSSMSTLGRVDYDVFKDVVFLKESKRQANDSEYGWVLKRLRVSTSDGNSLVYFNSRRYVPPEGTFIPKMSFTLL